MIGRRNAWIAARARNAARRGGWIAAIATVGGIAVLAALVLVPRELDRQLRQRIALLPSAPDSMPIIRRGQSLRSQLQVQERLLSAAPSADAVPSRDSTPRDSARLRVGPDSAIAARSRSRPDNVAGDLMARVARARTAPLAESYRALAESPMLKRDARARVLIDSIEVVDREREAHAALGGPGARYAALTARLTALGARLVRLADQQLAQVVPGSVTAARTPLPNTDSAVQAPGDSTAYRAAVVTRDSTIDALRRDLARQESTLVTARQRLVQYDDRRAALERRLSVDIPRSASLFAALVIGLALGYGVVLARELRRPTVGDASEVERIAEAPVLRHTREAATARVSLGKWRERPGVPRIIDRESDTFVVLHLALTGVGDVVDTVDVLASDPVIGAAVALGTAAAATRESRAVLVVEDSARTPVLARLLHLPARPAMTASRRGPARSDDSIHVVTLDRDAHVDVRLSARAGASHDSATTRQMPEMDSRYDLQLHLTDADDEARMADAPRDVILCVRQGTTPLAWLSRVTRQARRRQQRVRGVVLWSRDVPAGS